MRLMRFLSMPTAASTLGLMAALTLSATSPTLGAQQAPQSIGALLKRPVDATRELNAGDRKTGSLADASLMLEDSSRVELWYFRGTAGQRVTVRQRSEDFDTFMHVGLQGSDEPLVQNDDSEDDGVNSAAELTLPSDGVYVIIANAYDGEGRGAYTVSLEVRPPAAGMTGPFTPARITLRDAEPAQRLGRGQRFGSQLDERDGKMDDGTHFEVWYVQAAAGDTLQLRVESAQFAPALHVGLQGSGSLLGEASGAPASALSVVVPQAGMYAIIVRGATPGATGSYVLEVSGGAPTRR